MTRISDLGLQQLLLQGFQRTQNAAETTQIQLASGNKSQTYGGYGADALRLISSEGVITRATAYETSSQLALSRLQTQETSLTTVSDAVDGVRAAFSRTLATGNSELLLPDIEVAAQRILTALNVQSGGVYLFGGTDGTVPPVDAQSLSDLGAAPSIDGLFNEGEQSSLAVEEGVNISGGPLASDVARDLLGELQDLANAEATYGPFQGELTAAQRDFIVEKNQRLAAIADSLIQTQGVNGAAQGQANDAIARNGQRRDLAEVAAADIKNVDVAEAITRLNQDQLAVRASAQALAQATQLSLLNYL